MDVPSVYLAVPLIIDVDDFLESHWIFSFDHLLTLCSCSKSIATIQHLTQSPATKSYTMNSRAVMNNYS